jgi:LytS/YehU family sensor histidine kinase
MTPRTRILLHIAYWLAALVFFALYYGQKPGDFTQNLAYAALLLPVTIGTTYFILYRLIPRYLLRRKYARFSLYLVYTVIASVYLELLVSFVLYMTLADYQAMVVQPDFPGVVDGLLGMYFFVALAVAAHLAERWYRLQQARHAMEVRLKEAELALLKSQIQPHFMFNALNSLYALALERSDDTPDLILKLSTLLDYVLYRAGSDRVDLALELDMIRAYVDLESVRCADRTEVALDLPPEPPAATIAPLLILPLVENAFKHGVHPSDAPSHLTIRVTVEHGRLRVEVRNTLATADATRSGGIGLENLRARLVHLHPEAHDLTTSVADGWFTARMTVPLSS